MKCIGRPIVYVNLSRKGGRAGSGSDPKPAVYMRRSLWTEWINQKDFQSTKLLDFVIFCEKLRKKSVFLHENVQ